MLYYSHPLIMGILNITPDSFSDGGKFFNTKAALNHAEEMIKAGADIIDIGGESTRPGSESVSENEELDRVIPVVDGILEKYPDAVISIDTTKRAVALEALKRGAAIINDISGLTFEPEIAEVVAQFDANLVIMHIKGTPKDMQLKPDYSDVVLEVYEFLEKQSNFAKAKGVKKIIIDPGIGFGKKVSHNYELLKNLNVFKLFGYPVLIGLSRKSFLGKSLNLEVNERDTATVIAETLALKNGADIIRTHNVKNAFESRQIHLNFMNPQSSEKNNV
ncbi:MAG: dihydropteroate synthase [Bacteroidota bacterium]|nr:dihydropteroate synthase [Bacteroidota bacterium]MDP4193947.1 dihydropteroate synthase [Bacteroidota bacterium]